MIRLGRQGPLHAARLGRARGFLGAGARVLTRSPQNLRGVAHYQASQITESAIRRLLHRAAQTPDVDDIDDIFDAVDPLC